MRKEQDTKSRFTLTQCGRATAEGGYGKWERNNTLLLYLVPAETLLSCFRISVFYFIHHLLLFVKE